jgi:RNA polymerase sigma-70 factor (ECF subfamily)
VLLEKNMNSPARKAIFIFEGLRVATGRVIMLEAVALGQTEEDPLDLAVREHARLVYRVAYSVLRNHQDAEDTTQETFLRVLRYRRTMGGVRDQRTWLARIAWRVAVERRRKTPEVALEDAGKGVAQLLSPAAGAEKIILAAEMIGLMQRIFATLPDKLRDPLTLSTLEEMSPADIAEVLGTSESAVRSRLFRARQIVRQKLTTLQE